MILSRLVSCQHLGRANVEMPKLGVYTVAISAAFSRFRYLRQSDVETPKLGVSTMQVAPLRYRLFGRLVPCQR